MEVTTTRTTRQSARDIIGTLVCTMRAEGLTWQQTTEQLPARAWQDEPEAWAALTRGRAPGSHARHRSLGSIRTQALGRHGMALRAAQVADPEHLRDAINDRLDNLYAALTDKANRDGVDHRVVDTLRKIEADRARLYGLHAREEGGALASAIAELVSLAPSKKLEPPRPGDVQQGAGGVEGGIPKTR